MAATLTANPVDLPGHSFIAQAGSCELQPDGDLGSCLVTTPCALRASHDIDTGPAAGKRLTDAFSRAGQFHAAALFLQRE